MKSLAPAAEEVADALRRGFFSMAFQPIVETTTGAVYGFEALLRGATSTALEYPATVFCNPPPIPRPLLHELDLACIRASLKGGRRLPASTRLFVNAHGETLWYADRQGHDLFELLESVGMPPNRIVLEISENTSKRHLRLISRALRTFRQHGMQVALDDVGTTDAWLHHLMILQPDYMKIDRRMIHDIARSSRKQDLLSGLLLLGERMSATLIAEGVETAEENMAIRKVGVPYAQGYWLGRPAPVEHWLVPELEAADPGPRAHATYENAASPRKGESAR